MKKNNKFSTKLRKSDDVIVITGKHKGERGQILKFYPQSHKVLVKGVNLVTKHIKPNQENESGGIEQIEAPISISNVALALTKGKNATLETTKISMRFKKVGHKIVKSRISKKNGKVV